MVLRHGCHGHAWRHPRGGSDVTVSESITANGGGVPPVIIRFRYSPGVVPLGGLITVRPIAFGQSARVGSAICICSPMDKQEG